MKFGVSPFGIWRNTAADPLGSDTTGSQSYDIISADTRKWVKQEWIDYIVPQLYWYIGQYPAADYARLVPWWARRCAAPGVQLYIGQADYKSGDPAYGTYWMNPRELSDHLTLNRAYPEVLGNVHFSAVQVRANRLGATEHLRRRALLPAGAGADHGAPAGEAAAVPGDHQGRADAAGYGCAGGSRPTGWARSAPPRRTRSTASTGPAVPAVRPGRRGAPGRHRPGHPGAAESWVDGTAEPGRRVHLPGDRAGPVGERERRQPARRCALIAPRMPRVPRHPGHSSVSTYVINTSPRATSRRWDIDRD